jgi:hypothetical protein
MSETPIIPTGRPVPDARDLRLVADWSSAARGRPLHFAFRDGHLSVGDESDCFLWCDTKPYATRPQVRMVEVAVHGVEPLFLCSDEYSALVWGESAVEKFLFPYYASAAGRDAAALLTDLSAVWYDYPPTVDVCAIAYGFGSNPARGVKLTLRDTVGVVFVDRGAGAVRLRTLDGFLEEVGVRRKSVRRSHEEVNRASNSHQAFMARTTSVVLREAAEYVSGARPKPVRFTAEGPYLVPSCHCEQPQGTWFSAAATVQCPERCAPTQVTLVVDFLKNGVPEPLDCELLATTRDTDATCCSDGGTRDPDAAFWSDGAVEKLLLPYYASVDGWLAPALTGLTMAKWAGRVQVDVEDAGKITGRLNEPVEEILRFLEIDWEKRRMPDAEQEQEQERKQKQNQVLESNVYAITHLPQSEYIYEDGTQATTGVEHRIMLHTRSVDGCRRVPLVRPRPRGARNAQRAGG